MNRVLIASIAHAVNRAYCASMGDDSHPAWDDAAPEQKASILAGVDMHVAHADATPEASHAAWLEQKTAEGWSYGEVKDAQAKVHPCMLPYEQLPADQKAKDYIFRAVVHALKDIADADAPRPEPLLVAVKYVGPRDRYVDGAYGTGIAFERDETRLVPVDIARKFLAHKDVYVAGDPASANVAPLNAVSTDEDAVQDMRDSINAMSSKKALADFAKTNFGQTVDQRQSIAALRLQVTNLVDQFGAV